MLWTLGLPLGAQPLDLAFWRARKPGSRLSSYLGVTAVQVWAPKNSTIKQAQCSGSALSVVGDCRITRVVSVQLNDSIHTRPFAGFPVRVAHWLNSPLAVPLQITSSTLALNFRLKQRSQTRAIWNGHPLQYFLTTRQCTSWEATATGV